MIIGKITGKINIMIRVRNEQLGVWQKCKDISIYLNLYHLTLIILIMDLILGVILGMLVIHRWHLISDHLWATPIQ
jgi:hypothetical protein